jgi:hypothetical protein
MSVLEESPDADMAHVRAPGSRFVSAMLRGIGWFGLAIGALVFAVRIYRAFTEGVPTLTWGAILFLAPLSYLGFGFLSILSSKCFALERWYRGLVAIAGSVILPVLALTTTDYLCEMPFRTTYTEFDSHDWAAFRVPTTPFAVVLPTSPTKESRVVESAMGEIQIDMYVAECGAVQFVVAVNDYAPGTVDSLKSEEKDFATHMSDAAMEARSGSKLISRRSIAVDEWGGLEQRVEMPGGRTGDLKPEHPVVVWQKYYQCEDRMILFQVMTLKRIYETGAVDFDDIAARFLDSIHLEADATVESAPNAGH